MNQTRKIILAVLITAIVVGGGFYLWYEAQPKVEAPLTLKPEIKEVEKISVSSQLYDLQIPVPEGFEFEKLAPDGEFILKHQQYPDLIFYFESDYSPYVPEDAVAKISELISKQGTKFTVAQYKTDSGFLYYIEAKDDKNFHFSVIHDNDNVDIKSKLIEDVANDLSFSRRY